MINKVNSKSFQGEDQDDQVIASDSKYENLSETQLKRLSMPTGYHYNQNRGGKATKTSSTRKDKPENNNYHDMHIDNPVHYDIPADLEMSTLETAGMETSIYDNNRYCTSIH